MYKDKEPESAKKLREFLEKNYIENPKMGSGDMSTAIRDMLTDLIWIANLETPTIELDERLEGAYEVFNQEID